MVEAARKCLLIGDDGFTVSCGEILLQLNYEIICLISVNKAILTWGSSHGLLCCSNIDEFLATPSTKSFALLISASNGSLIPKVLIDRATCYAINFHNSLLPLYAGVHAPAWAIINGEREHGVTWHLLTAEIDSGDIIKQTKVVIRKDETTASLNLKCFELGLATFKEILNDYDLSEPLTATQQAKKQRSYYGYSRVIPNDGIVLWSVNSAEYIERLTRALNFGDYDNPLGLAKIMLTSDQYLIIKSVNILSTKSIERPGKIIQSKGDQFRISTVTRDIEVAVIRPYGLSKGPTLETGMCLHDFNVKIDQISKFRKQEISYIDVLKNTTSHMSFRSGGDASKKPHFITQKIYQANLQVTFEDLLFSVLVYLWKLNNEQTLIILYARNIIPKLAHIHPFIPVGISITSIVDLQEYIQKVFLNHNEGLINNAMSKDIFDRISRDRTLLIPELCVINGNIKEITENSHRLISNFNFIIDIYNRSIYIIYNNLSHSHMLSDLLLTVEHHINQIIAYDKSDNINDLSIITSAEIEKIIEFSCSKCALPKLIGNNVIEQLLMTVDVANYKDNIFIDNFTFKDIFEKVELVSRNILSILMKEKARVALVFERSVEYIIAMLSVLNNGFAFVPIEKGTPDSKINLIIENLAINLVISDIMPDKIVCDKKIDYESLTKLQGTYIHKKGNVPQLDDIAYIIFTSGSTGSPKGVSITHKNILNYLSNFISHFEFDHRSVMDFSCTIAFDLSIPCIFAPLLTGGKICICAKDIKMNASEYINYLRYNHITHVELTPGYFNSMISCGKFGVELNSLRWILLGAEALSKLDVIKWHSSYPAHKIVNEYGPTEVTVAASFWEIDFDYLQKLSSIPIGRPFANLVFYVVDKKNQPVPIGCAGELCIHGDQVSSGYIGNLSANEEKFVRIQDITDHKKNMLFYKTGDVVRWGVDGLLYFIGRIDEQTKIHGYRTNINEIISKIVEVNGVIQATVVNEKNEYNDKLICYYISKSKDIKAEILRHLKSSLAVYQIPSEYHQVPYFPLKSNEKIDYLALSRLICTKHKEKFKLRERNSSNSSKLTVDSIATDVIDIWTSMLPVEELSVCSDFFLSGGNSISALKIIDKINENYKINITIESLIENKTIESLSNYIYKIKNKLLNEQKNIIELNVFDKNKPVLFLVHPVGGNVFCYKPLARSLEGKVNVYGIFDAQFSVSGNGEYTSAEQMAIDYAHSICSLLERSDVQCYIGGASFGANISLSVAYHLMQMQRKINAVFLFDGWAFYPRDIAMDKIFSGKSDLIENLLKNKLLEQQVKRRSLLDTYSPKIPKCSVILFKCKEIWTEFLALDEPTNHWRALIEFLSVIKVDGNHETMLSGYNVINLSSYIRDILAADVCIEDLTST